MDSALQQWSWTPQWYLRNGGTQRCLSTHMQPVQTVPCKGPEGLQWLCRDQGLLSLNSSLELSVEKSQLSLSNPGKNSKWRSLDEGDICKDKLRPKRASHGEDEIDFGQSEDTVEAHSMTEEQRAFLRWYYRTEDQTTWKFVMLALSVAALLLGSVLLVTGMMASRSRKKINKYKLAATRAAKPEADELQVITEVIAEVKGDKEAYTAPTQDSHPDSEPASENSEADKLKPGEIIVTWKDGSVSNLYPEEPPAEEAVEEEK